MTWLRVFVAVGVVAVLGACDDDDPVGLEPGTIQVEVTTSGEGTDDDGFTVSLDGGIILSCRFGQHLDEDFLSGPGIPGAIGASARVQ